MPRSASSRHRVAAHRAELRRQGLRPIQIWVPDTRAPGFAEECARQARLVSRSPEAEEVMDWIERNSVWEEEWEAEDPCAAEGTPPGRDEPR